MIYRAFPESFRRIWQICFRIQKGIHAKIPSNLRINPVQRNIFYSFSLCTKDGYSSWNHTVTKLQMREVCTYIQLKFHHYPPGLEHRDIATIATISSSTWFLKTLFESSFKWRTDSRRTSNRKLFSCHNRTHWHSPLPTFSGTWQRSTATKETYFIMFFNILNISHLNNIRDADSRAGNNLTNSWRCNTFCTKPSFPCILDCLPSQHDFLPTRLKIGYNGASLWSSRCPGVKLE